VARLEAGSRTACDAGESGRFTASPRLPPPAEAVRSTEMRPLRTAPMVAPSASRGLHLSRLPQPMLPALSERASVNVDEAPRVPPALEERAPAHMLVNVGEVEANPGKPRRAGEVDER